jgi:hypothetical protein
LPCAPNTTRRGHLRGPRARLRPSCRAEAGPGCELWASVPATADVEHVKALLEEAGVDPASIFKERANGQTLSAAVRELEASETGIPPALQEAISINEVWKVGFTDNGARSNLSAA